MDDVALFERIVALGSIAAGGEACGLSATVSSDRLKRLESDLGCTLLNRTTRSMSLTDEGARFLSKATELIKHFEETRHSVGKRSTSLIGPTSVAAPMLFGKKFLPDVIKTYLTNNPEARIKLNLSDEILDYAAKGIDVAIRIGRLKDSTFRARKLRENDRVLCGSPSYLDSRGIPSRPSDLEAHDCIVFMGDNVWCMQNARKNVHVQVHGRFDTNSAEMATQACLDGLGIALRSLWDVAEHLEAGRLVRVLPKFDVPTEMSIYAIFPPGRFISPAAKAFVGLVSERMRRLKV